MTEIISQTPPVFYAIYGAVALLFLMECVNAVLKMIYMNRHGLVKAEKLLYGFFMGVAIATLLMTVRTVINIYNCEGTAMTVLRVMSSGMVIYVIFLAARMLWAIKVKMKKDDCQSPEIK